jgi:hypothetical protein
MIVLRLERSGNQLIVYANGSGLATPANGPHIGALPAGLYAEACKLMPLTTRYYNVLTTSLSGGQPFEAGLGPGRRSAQMVQG